MRLLWCVIDTGAALLLPGPEAPPDGDRSRLGEPHAADRHYAAASGAGGEYDASGPYYGVIVRNPLSTNVYSVADGLSNTFVIAEKRARTRWRYATGDNCDDQGFTDGWDNDIICLTNYPFGPDVNTNLIGYQFGSAHMQGMNAVFADGSVRVIGYGTPTAVLEALGDRRDGVVVPFD